MSPKSPQREVVRSSPGAGTIFPFKGGGSFAQHTPKHEIGCLTPCKIIILGDKIIPDEFLDDDSSSPPGRGYHFFGVVDGGGGVETFLRIMDPVCRFRPWSGIIFLLYTNPLTNGRCLRCELPLPQAGLCVRQNFGELGEWTCFGFGE